MAIFDAEEKSETSEADQNDEHDTQADLLESDNNIGDTPTDGAATDEDSLNRNIDNGENSEPSDEDTSKPS